MFLCKCAVRSSPVVEFSHTTSQPLSPLFLIYLPAPIVLTTTYQVKVLLQLLPNPSIAKEFIRGHRAGAAQILCRLVAAFMSRTIKLPADCLCHSDTLFSHMQDNVSHKRVGHTSEPATQASRRLLLPHASTLPFALNSTAGHNASISG
jgi:hypothetical protein